ncbi:MAG: SusC/RagA family TonB-linked outer membrane protein [Sphingomonadales bacterium]|nr:SusC/RagA family TonB-linked outer membrane protein [Sphingomonadales bacterium]
MRTLLHVLLACTLFLFVLPAGLYAQDRTVTGTVVADESKSALAGVTIRVKGTRRITQTDANGKFSIKVNTGEVLQISSVGYETTDIKIGSGDALGISLKTADNTLGEVVVTAMDIKRNPRSMGYSTQTLKGEEIQETQRENFINSLQGRVAGLTLDPTSGIAGASSSIVLRGFNSLSLSNQPLYVVDGVVMDNSTLNETSTGGTSNGLASDRSNRLSDYQNRIADLNPNDIESLTVLKGPEATALYGSQASSGAIIITTKKTKTNKFGLQYDNSFRFQEVTRFPETLESFSPGVNGVASQVFGRFGPAYPSGTELYDNVGNFFRTGKAQTHNLGLDFGIGEAKFRASGSIFDQQGVVPNNDFRRYNARISNTTKFFKGKLEVSPSVAYSHSINNKVLRSGGGFLLGLLIWPQTNDIRKFENDQLGDKLDLFEGTDGNSEIDNPLWNVNNNFGEDKNTRLTYTLGVNLNPVKWLTINGRFGYDTYDQNGFLFFHPQSFYLNASVGGSLDNYWRKYAGYNHTIMATIKKDLTKNLNLRIMGGTMWQDYTTKMWAVQGQNIVDSVGLARNLSGGNGKMYKNGKFISDRDLEALMGNYMDSTVTLLSTRKRLNRNKFNEYNYSTLRQLAYFGEVALSYKNYLFLNYTHRFEQASTLAPQFRNYDYPGVSVSAIISDMIPAIKKNSFISYWKLRTSRATTARLNSPYSTQSFFVDNLSSGGGYSWGFTNSNEGVRPEQQKTYELGTEMRMFNNRLSIDFTYYNTLNDGQIIENYRLSYGTGYILNTQNAGSTRNKGIEIILNYAMIKSKDFSWDMTFNFNRMRNRVEKLPEGTSEFYIADTWLYGAARGGLVKGRPTTTITGNSFQRNLAGQILIDPATGMALRNIAYSVIGDRNPDFTCGWINNLRYKRWKLSILWDSKVGGDIFNGTNLFMTINGLSKKTADRYTPRVVAGVLRNGLENTATPTVNTISVIPAYNTTYYTTMPEEEFIERDVNFIRLRDITLSYTFKRNIIKGFTGLSAFVTGNDLLLLTNYSGADPSVNGNTAAGRGVGAFGFDYGTLSAPMQVNVGVRASF